SKFIPLGISAYYSKGRVLLYVVNSHPARQCVEIFTYHKDKNVLFYRKSEEVEADMGVKQYSGRIKHHSIQKIRLVEVHAPLADCSLYDVVVVGADRFFVSNLAYMGKGKLQTAELLMQSSFGALYFFDGRKVTLHESGLSSPSALAIDRQRKLIFVGSLMNEVRLSIYKNCSAVLHSATLQNNLDAAVLW
ncbi:unnamed protein product, partial [Cylicostephanus goldi]